MHPPCPAQDNSPEATAVPRPGTVAAARQWLAKIARDSDATVTIQESVSSPGFVVVTGTLVRQDGHRINVAVHCVADRPRTPAPDWYSLPAVHPHGRSSLN